ncbi:MAG: sirohydrochlorin chelatase [Anaerolineae bacterium]|nr:sirohydrochlorin chelatase [Anaerolineae bacterium]
MKEHGLVLIGHGSQHPETTGEFHQFAQSLAVRLGIHVQPCFLEFNDPPIAEAIRQCVQMGLTQITVLPLFLSAGVHQKNDVPNIINEARQQWPHVRFQYCAPIGVQYHTLSAMSDRLSAATRPNEQIAAEKTAVAVVGYGTRDPDANAEVARLARLLYEGRDFGWVEPAYYLLTKPNVNTIIQRFAQLGAQRVIVLPYLIFTGYVYERMIEQATQVAAAAGLQITIAPYLFPHPALLEAVAERFDEAVNGKANMTCDLCKYRRKMAGQENEFGLAQAATHRHGLGAKNTPMHDFEQRLAQWLPPKYQKNTQVSAMPMPGAAGLEFDQNGEVAWDNMWTDFCDLALAGGPAHRGELLEPVAPDLIAQDPQGYDAAMREIVRGITMVTDLAATPASAGWVCVPCDSDDMAIWLLRAIVVENVFARREGTKLLLPVGPNYTLKNEIKSIVTVVAKTHHYWREHIIALNNAKKP